MPVSVACRPDDLTWNTGLVDGAMGLRAVGVVAHNAGRAPCWLDGVAQVRVGQGGRPLALTVRAGELGSPGQDPRRVGIPPGGAAQLLLTWRTSGGIADGVTQQAVTVALVPGGPERAVPLAGGPAPLDIADGGELYVSGWTPAAR